MEVGRGDRSSCLADGLGSVAAGSGWVDRGEGKGKGLGFLFRFVVDAKKQWYPIDIDILMSYLLHW